MWNFRDLKVWEKWVALVEEIYIILLWFPKEEIYWIISQIKRSAVSIPSNIAEWYERNSSKDFIRFLLISKWSCAELETQLIISNKLWYITEEILNNLLEHLIEIRKMISGLITKLKEND